ncbi:flavodoxin family protein [Clostridium beijerinckii]|uniref:Flavodoxin n=1 Tax=Clostridium beijerinckii TaxID=1520 RepID=A0A1S9N075_CLOBE|nr:flavodoxin family protein [Clostridium beijerinckii]MZK53119.1 flavodoxin [Clostridium beijerinckii]MZK61243.1 flavodoxin [Clostridium beijerinckii]MZK71442.1 flavodoxin [Clostridium beijerinckii]MZK76786.1 flavodoxin [Clostridium beijerinckii]MZK86509.1 flavodoxin [Clostridium beijerinckii]
MKLSIVYHSESGNTEKAAEIIVNAIEQMDGIEVKAMNINNIDENFINESEAVIFGSPTYCGTCSWQMKKFLDTSGTLKLDGKLGGVVITENFIGGGADFAEITLMGCLLVRGMMVYSGGVKQVPTHFGAVLIKDGDEYQINKTKIFAQKFAKRALELFN